MQRSLSVSPGLVDQSSKGPQTDRVLSSKHNWNTQGLQPGLGLLSSSLSAVAWQEKGLNDIGSNNLHKAVQESLKVFLNPELRE